jgi:hypothetical protein
VSQEPNPAPPNVTAGTSIDAANGRRQPSFEPHQYIQTPARRREIELECYKLTEEIAELRTKRGLVGPESDPAQIFADGSAYQQRQEGGKSVLKTRVNASTMSNDHLLKTVQDLRATAATERKKLGRA